MEYAVSRTGCLMCEEVTLPFSVFALLPHSTRTQLLGTQEVDPQVESSEEKKMKLSLVLLALVALIAVVYAMEIQPTRVVRGSSPLCSVFVRGSCMVLAIRFLSSLASACCC
jgi:hypothetical protein